MPIPDDLLDLERRGWKALAREGEGTAFYAEVLDDNPIMLLPGGLVLEGRDACLDAMAGPPWASYDLSDERVVVLGEDGGVVTYRVAAQREASLRYDALVSSTYVRRPGGWRLAVHQQTPV